MRRPAVRRAPGLAASVLAAASSIAAQPAPPPRIEAIRVAEPITIDGRLDEDVWKSHEPFELLYESRPAPNTPAPVRTFAWIAYDDRNFYFAFRADDPEPEKIRARFADRDTSFDDDSVGVILDPFHDGRRAFEFFVNPNGIQVDVLENDIVGGDDPTWDAIWNSAGRIDERGFAVEAAIPFSSLRYPRTTGEQVWGFNALRFWPRDTTRRLALDPLDRTRNCNLCQIGELGGIRDLEPRLDLEFDPTLTAARTDTRESFPDSPLRDGPTEGEAGLTFRWGVTPNLTLHATLNPDFSQVEADARQLDVNTQFALSYPEKRPFFLEGADLFATAIGTVYTRNLADPDWGLKLTGKAGPNAIGLLASHDAVTNLLFPAAEGSAFTSLDGDSDAAILRYRRDLPLPGSTTGLMYTGRRSGDYRNHVVGSDSLLRLGERHSLRFEGFLSTTRYPDEVAAELDQPHGEFDGSALRLSYSYNSQRWYGYGVIADFDDGFRADLGFVPQVGYRQGLAGLERVWRTDGDDWYNEIRSGGEVHQTDAVAGGRLEREADLWWDFAGKLESTLRIQPGYRQRAYRGVEFDQSYLNLAGGVRPLPWFSFSLEATIGDAIDFANVRAADQLRLDPGLLFDLGRHVRVTLDHTYERLRVAGDELYRANLSRLGFTYQIDRRTQVRLISQRLDVRRDPTLYREPIDARTRQLGNQLLFSWKLNPQTVFFAGYSDTFLGDQTVDLTRASATYFFKLGYAWLP